MFSKINRKNGQINLFFIVYFILFTSILKAQSLELIQNPPSHSNASRGYQGTPYEHNGELFLRYQNNNGVNQLYKLDEVNLSLVTTPSNHTNAGSGYLGEPFTYNNELFLRYLNNNRVAQLFKYNGINLSLIPNPPNHTNITRGYQGDPFEFNGELFLRYQNNSSFYQLYRYNGTTLSLIPNPSNHNNNFRGYEGDPFEFNGELLLRYQNNNGVRQLYKLNGSSLSLVPNPPNHTNSGSGYLGEPFELNDELFLRYVNNDGVGQLYKFDGTSLTLIPNPPNHTNNTRGYRGEPFKLHGELFLMYVNNDGVFQLYKYDGSSLTLIPNPPNHTFSGRGYLGNPYEYSNKLFLSYINNDGVVQLYKYDGTSLIPIPNPPNHTNFGRGYQGNPYEYNNELFLSYINNDGVIQLYKYDGTSLILIPNPPNHSNNLAGYQGFTYEYNGSLFFRFRTNGFVNQLYRYIPPITWTGIEDTNWHNSNNWDAEEVPTIENSVLIPSLSSNDNYPVANNNLEVNSIILGFESSLKINATFKVNERITNNGQITFKSTEDKTAQFDTFTGTYSGNGTVEVERYIPEGRRAFRFISPTVTTSTSIFENWQENGGSPTGFGTHVTGEGAPANGFDETATNNPSLFSFDNLVENQNGGAAWDALSNTDINTLNAGAPYRVLVRGDRNVDLTSNTPTATETVLRARGDLHLGDYSPVISSFDANFNFVGNPYQATVNSKEISYAGDINNNYIYVWDAQQGSNGSYVTIDMLDGSNTVGSNANEFIQPGQAFFIRNNLVVNTPPSITFTEASKEVSEEQLSTFSAPNYAKVNLQLFTTTSQGEQIADAIGLRFSEDFQNEVNDADAGKMGNSGENLALVSSNQLLSIEQRNNPYLGEEILLFINNFQNENYKFKLDTEQWDETLTIFIKDAYLDELTPIEAGEEYAFSIQSGIAETSSPFRFSLVFGYETLSNDDFENTSFSVYPNPTKDTFYISGVEENVSLDIYDLLGRKVFSQNQVNNQQGINISQLSNGVYFVKAREGEKLFTQKLVKK